jgi:hypothetical protein
MLVSIKKHDKCHVFGHPGKRGGYLIVISCVLITLLLFPLLCCLLKAYQIEIRSV